MIDAKKQEDILQFILSNGKIVDVGYYPSQSPDGKYVCLLVTKPTPEAWDNPELKYIATSYEDAIAWAESFRE